MKRVHGPVVAGTFYPAAPERLERMVSSLLATNTSPPVAGTLHGLIVPHAALVYSGAVAAAAFSLVGAGAFGRVVAIGPSHFVGFDGIASLQADGWATPLGVMPVDRIAESGVVEVPSAFVREHCLEVELPFLQRTLGAVPVVPLLCGTTNTEDTADTLETLVGPPDLLVVSSDLSHDLPLAEASRIDAATARAVVRLGAGSFGPGSACGLEGIRGAIELCRRRGWEIDLLRLATSADAGGDPARVVGYGAFAIVAR
jgi:AmmeMemoRadiSam system protein B